jgi:hypothetical protein
MDDRSKDEFKSTDEQPPVKIQTSENVKPVGTEDEKVNLEPNPDVQIIEGKDINSEKHASLLNVSPDQPSSDASIEAYVSGDTAWEYITGLKLLIVIMTLSVAAFMIWLDTSIVATVSRLTRPFEIITDSLKRPLRE